jgi:hypothetical protein
MKLSKAAVKRFVGTRIDVGDKSNQRDTKDSNALLQSGWQHCEPLPIEVVLARNPS